MPKTPSRLTRRISLNLTEGEYSGLITRANEQDRTVSEEARRAVSGQSYLNEAIGLPGDTSRIEEMSTAEAQVVIHSLGYVVGHERPVLPDPAIAKAALIAIQSFR